MAITWSSAGAGVSTETSGAALSPLCPATVTAGDILIAQVAWEGTTTTPSTPANWTLISGPHNVGSASVVARQWIFGKIADGTEDGGAVAFGAPAVTTQRAARVHRFLGRVSGAITDLVTSFATNLVGDTDPTGPTVTTTVAGALAVAAVYQNDNNTLETFAGSSDTWTERGTAGGYIFALAPGGVLDLLTATPAADPGTVSGGAMTVTNDPWGVIGFEIRPSVPAVTGTGALASGASTVDGAGVSGSTGTGALAAGASAIDGAGVSESTGSGALAAGAATIAGAGDVADAGEITGTGALAAGAAAIDGAGVSESAGSGALAAGTSTVAGAGVSASTGSGALAAASASIDGAGVSESTGSGALVAGVATVSGAGDVADEEPITGAGDLVCGSSSISGAGDVSGVAAGLRLDPLIFSALMIAAPRQIAAVQAASLDEVPYPSRKKRKKKRQALEALAMQEQILEGEKQLVRRRNNARAFFLCG